MDEESQRATDLLQTRTVHRVARHRPGEILVEFTDGVRLFVHVDESGYLEISITGCDEDEQDT
jgi:hypothetical protein